MTEAIQAVWLTGVFTVAGVVVTAAIGGIGAMLRRRWAVEDAEREALRVDQRELRELRRDAYAELLSAFNHTSNLHAELAAKVAEGSAPLLSDVDSSIRAFLDYLDEHDPTVEALDALTFRAIVVASDPVAKLIQEVERELMNEFAIVATGRWKPDGSNNLPYVELRRALMDAMRSELTASPDLV
jgi:hypothetical protein